MTPTEPDPVIDEIRAIRHRISARFGHDPHRLVSHYLDEQDQHPPRLIDRPAVEGDGSRPVVEGA